MLMLGVTCMHDSVLQGAVMGLVDDDVELRRARCLIVKITSIPFILAATLIVFYIWR